MDSWELFGSAKGPKKAQTQQLSKSQLNKEGTGMATTLGREQQSFIFSWQAFIIEKNFLISAHPNEFQRIFVGFEGKLRAILQLPFPIQVASISSADISPSSSTSPHSWFWLSLTCWHLWGVGWVLTLQRDSSWLWQGKVEAENFSLCYCVLLMCSEELHEKSLPFEK